jgi:signal transduction histidine kinase
VLVNLLSNAIKFSPTNGVVSLQIHIDTTNAVTFRVSDQGPGIPKKWQEQLFSKFAQVEGRQEGAAVGSGLGLTFCKLAIEAQNGTIWVEPHEGQGTSICFTLPLVEG